MECLSCNKEMTNYLVHTFLAKLSYDMCEECGSFWLDEGELNKLAYQVTGDIEICSIEKAKDISQHTKRCPRCEDIELDKVVFLKISDIILDRCGNCGGYWLDGGELDLVNRELEEIMPVEGKGFSKFVNDVHLPFWCKKIRRKSRETDFNIDVPVIKGCELITETSLQCPACDSTLNEYAIFGIKIEGCDKCKGIFLDIDELRRLKDKKTEDSWATLRWMDDEVESIEETKAVASKKICPKCNGVKFFSTKFGDSKIIIDWCPSCHGTWLDRDEFQDIIDLLESKLFSLSSSEMAKIVEEEEKEIWDGPEGKISELKDVIAARKALDIIRIYEHPVMANFLLGLPRF